MAFQVRTTKAAELQIETAYLWLKKRNPLYADEWFKGLMNAIASLQEKPRRCSLATESEVFSEEVRQLLYGKSRNRYRILFTIREDIVHILFVRHTSQALLTEDELGDYMRTKETEKNNIGKAIQSICIVLSIFDSSLKFQSSINSSQYSEEYNNLIETYQIYREHIKHEDTLGNQRISILIATQSFLFFPYFSILGKAELYNFYYPILLLLICGLGIFINWLIKPSIEAFVKSADHINERCKYYLGTVKESHESNNSDLNIEFYTYQSGQNNKNNNLEKIGETEKIENSENLSFLK